MYLGHPRGLKSVTVHVPSVPRRVAVFAVLAVLYAVAGYSCITTIGEPLATAQAQAQALEDTSWDERLDALDAAPDADGDALPLEDVLDLPSSPRRDDDMDEFEVDSQGGAAHAADVDDGNDDADLWDSGADDAAATPPRRKPAAAKPKRPQTESDKLADELGLPPAEAAARPLPSPYLPNAFALAGLLGCVVLHALFHLLCHWSVWFKGVTMFAPASTLAPGAFVQVTPEPHRGVGALCKLRVAAVTSRLVFTFQRQQYNVLSRDEAAAVVAAHPSAGDPAATAGIDLSGTTDDGSLIGAGLDNGAVQPVASPVDLPVRQYVSTAGLTADTAPEQEAQFGRNVLTIPTPNFLQLYKEQLLSPIAMFQVFCAVLWLLDEYWQYTGFTLFSLFAIESTTTFQRLRTLKTLHNMCTKPYPLQAYRGGKWQERSSQDLLPGDLISVHWHPSMRTQSPASASTAVATNGAARGGAGGNRRDCTPQGGAGAGAGAGAAPATVESQVQASVRAANSDVVPCDCLLLRGKAVVNEATLTGESVPQMKDALAVDVSDPVAAERQLDMEGSDRVHVLFSGTTLINALHGDVASPPSGSDSTPAARRGDALPTTPDGGALAYVLRTGFSSSQGKLVQLIEFSTQKVSADSRETWIALAFLLVVALVSAGYVLKKGMEKGNRTTHELLLKCVIILTSVVPQHLPMQMAMAVNTALLALNRAGIFCTEPFRVPLAGKITHCLFDKTGTLTTDQLVPVGVVCGIGSGTAALAGGAGAAGGSLAVGSAVKLHGLSAAAQFNGRTGVIRRPLDATAGRFLVELEATADEPAASKNIRPMNLQALPSVARVLVPVKDASPEAAMVLGACNALVSVDGAGLVGDPIELAALKGVCWRFDAVSQSALPGDWQPVERAAAVLQADLQKMAANSVVRKAAEKRLAALQSVAKAHHALATRSAIKSVHILHRHHFSSALQRMSVTCRVKATAASSVRAGSYCLVKGSPEAVGELLAEGGRPSWFDATYRQLAEQGMRVLALAYKSYSAEAVAAELGLGPAEAPPRRWVESNLLFAGFVAFQCKTRADSPMVIRALHDSRHAVAMVTGDAALTALHVAGKVGIHSGERAAGPTPALMLSVTDDGSGVEWVAAAVEGVAASAEDGTPLRLPFAVGTMRHLAGTYDLVTTEAALELAAAADPDVWRHVDVICVFARMSPHGKARVIRAMQQFRGADVLMCGDGGNDVGALKQAEVGLALLSGYGNMNTTQDGAEAGADTAEGDKPAAAAGTDAETALNEQSRVLRLRQQAASKRVAALLAAKRKELTAKMQREWLQEEMQARAARGESTGITASFSAMKAVGRRLQLELQRERVRLQKLHGNAFDAGAKGDKSAAEQVADAAESEVPMIRPGDASIAAPFTSRSPSVRAVVDLIRQGRCTLLSALQQQQIMMLECMIAAFTLSALSLEGARSSERQMMASSWLIMTASLAFSYSKPVDKMHPVRPLRSLFHPAVVLSTLGQAAIHLGCMVYAVRLAEGAMGPDKLAEVVEFNRRVKAGEAEQLRAEAAASGEEDLDPLADIWAMWSAPFKPNLLNTVVWLVETAQIVAVLFVNYKGRPWMKGVLENHALFLSIFACVAGVAACAWGISPEFNALLHLEAFPSDEFRWQVMALVATSLVGTFVWDRLCVLVLAPTIARATLAEAAKTTLADIMPLFTTLGKVAAGLLVLASNNILIMAGVAFWWYRRRQAKAKADMEAVL